MSAFGASFSAWIRASASPVGRRIKLTSAPVFFLNESASCFPYLHGRKRTSPVSFPLNPAPGVLPPYRRTTVRHHIRPPPELLQSGHMQPKLSISLQASPLKYRSYISVTSLLQFYYKVDTICICLLFKHRHQNSPSLPLIITYYLTLFLFISPLFLFPNDMPIFLSLYSIYFYANEYL